MVKKGDIVEIKIEDLSFPNRGSSYIEDKKIVIHNTLPGQLVKARIKKKRKSKIEGTLLEVIQPAENEIIPNCSLFGTCGGCTYQNLPYDAQLTLKESFIKELLKDFDIEPVYSGIKGSPAPFHYRNKMEFSFGDEYKDGPLVLGLHKRGSMYDIVDIKNCYLVDDDFNRILRGVLIFCTNEGYDYYHKNSHLGFLRHLVIRKGIQTGELLIELVTSSQGDLNKEKFIKTLQDINLTGNIKSIIHTINDSLSDTVQEDKTDVLFGQNYITDIINDLNFKITPRSFFQTNTLGAEVLYDVITDFIEPYAAKEIYDLYSGTGTITQILAKKYLSVTGVEIVPDAVNAAIENAKLNKIDNAKFICGDVLNVINDLNTNPEVIVLDPPRDGIHPKAIDKITDFAPEVFVYVSCKPTSLVRDLPFFLGSGYIIKEIKCVDMFPHTPHVETVVMLTKSKATK
ncbi:23S rRNA (uracil(1939)-C(5))-methyltransferase RlmD [Alkalibacter mobilis]|uniref:23S rRNA (uracil(1939)-C(5))-methyltransferase RlmD n=1 Tax=Alkalibacter mobilis TaxID=2787712 RepID=UPI00189F3D2B|nr:23S rRNA (uracil(1939)-C(5))-methyltransferase RlmD [Alkalibacter mobilis]MBF7097749.1 23S rRNA (uracil(1939)-C(5))-methyltransferase RlmD [Alkalibacter mobilis]